MKKVTTKDIAFIGIMAAMVYVSSVFLQIPISTPIDNTRLHMGNVMCLLSGMLLGAVPGGLAAGIGSVFFDLTNPAYIASAPFTFVFKFVMAWICGRITSKAGTNKKRQFVLGGVLGSFVYVALYLSKNFVEHRFIFELPMEAVMLTMLQKTMVSVTNAIVACLVAVPLGIALHQVIDRLKNNNE